MTLLYFQKLKRKQGGKFATFAANSDFPQIVGAIDGTFIKIIAPKDDPVAYTCRKKFHALVLQAVVDYNLKCMDIATGFPGSFHDARVLRLSSIFDRAEASDILSSPIENINGTNVRPLILGDGAYPLKSWLIKPYPHIGALTRSQRNFNRELSKNGANQSSEILQHSQNRPTGDRWLKF